MSFRLKEGQYHLGRCFQALPDGGIGQQIAAKERVQRPFQILARQVVELTNPEEDL